MKYEPPALLWRYLAQIISSGNTGQIAAALVLTYFFFAHGGICVGFRHVENPSTVPEHPSADKLPDLYMLCREYEATLQVVSDPEEKWRLYRNLQEIRACIIQIGNH